MRDLTQGSIPRQIVALAVPIFAGMLLQTLYYIVDLYFVSRIGNAAIAGVSAAGNIMFLVFALTQMLGVGIVALISQAVGRKDAAEANLVFNQSLVLSLLFSILTLVCGYAGTTAYMGKLGADAATVMMGTTYLYWFLPGLALQFALVAMGSALRGTGIVKPTMVVQGLTVLINIVLAPVLIAGWGSGHPLGVAGAGLASTIAIAFGVVLLAMYFFKLEKYVQLHPTLWAPRLKIWLRVFNIGLPAGGEFALMFGYMAIIFWIIRTFGSAAQAGFGVGSRVMQAMIFASHGSRFRDGADRWSEFWRATHKSPARYIPHFGVHDLWRDAAADFDLPVAECVTDSSILDRGGCCGRWRSVPDNHLLEFRGKRDHLYVLEYFSGTR